MDRAELKKGLKSLGILLAVMALVGAGSYFIGLLKSILYEKAEADAYGVASRYENWNNPTLAVFLWQEKEDADPDTVKEGTTLCVVGEEADEDVVFVRDFCAECRITFFSVEEKVEKHNNLVERMVKVEDSAKSAHRRIDDLRRLNDE